MTNVLSQAVRGISSGSLQNRTTRHRVPRDSPRPRAQLRGERSEAMIPAPGQDQDAAEDPEPASGRARLRSGLDPAGRCQCPTRSMAEVMSVWRGEGSVSSRPRREVELHRPENRLFSSSRRTPKFVVEDRVGQAHGRRHEADGADRTRCRPPTREAADRGCDSEMSRCESSTQAPRYSTLRRRRWRGEPASSTSARVGSAGTTAKGRARREG